MNTDFTTVVSIKILKIKTNQDFFYRHGASNHSITRHLNLIPSHVRLPVGPECKGGVFLLHCQLIY